MTALALRHVFERAQFAFLLFAAYGALGVYLFEKSYRPLEAPIVGYATVVDGDTILIASKRIRLAHIDAPEFDQTCGEDRSKLWFCGESAADELKKHLTGRKVRCEAQGYDHYRRVLGLCSLEDGSGVNAWAVREGWAVASESDAYKADETSARLAKRGIWSSQFMPPGEWRAQNHHSDPLRNGD